MKVIKQILVPVDFSRPSMQAAQYALEFCQTMNAKLELIHVIDFNVMTLYTAAPIVPSATFEASFKAGAQKLMSKFLKQLGPSTSVTSKIASGYGSTADTICREAKKTGADWIVMSTHGRTGFKRLMMGSVAERVVRVAPCPVLTVRGNVRSG